jgi:hypothetical protein
MILTTQQMVWTPSIGRDSVAVALNPVFAGACKAYELDPEQARTIAENTWKKMRLKNSDMPSNFLEFGGTLLLNGVYLKPGDGVWLTIEAASLRSTVQPVMYYGHNEDRFAEDRLELMWAFGEWVNMAVALLDWK